MQADDAMDAAGGVKRSPPSTPLQGGRPEKRQRMCFSDKRQTVLKAILGNDPGQSLDVGKVTASLNMLAEFIHRDGTGELPRDEFYSVEDAWSYLSGIQNDAPDDWSTLCQAIQTGRETGDWGDVINLSFIAKPPAVQVFIDRYTFPDVDATIRSWTESFKGNGAALLWKHITTYYKSSKELRLYAHICAVVQSSGMGKSRVIDELSKTHFVIPLCLGDEKHAGFPPPDVEVHDYLMKPKVNMKIESYKRGIALLAALFKQAASIIQDFLEIENVKPEHIASHFRDLMGNAPTYRKRFCHAVVVSARAIEAALPKLVASDFVYPPKIELQTLVSLLHGELPRDRLGQVSQPDMESMGQTTRMRNAPLEMNVGPSHMEGKKDGGPEVIIAFDEAQILKNEDKDKRRGWSPFSELRRAFRGVHADPVWGLFLSTTGKPADLEDESVRMQDNMYASVPPFTDLGFDLFVKPLSFDNSLALDVVTSVHFMVQFGRALLALRYLHGDNEIKSQIVRFAARKLLNRPMNSDDTNPMSVQDEFACLSQRLALEFNSTTYVSRQEEERQVEAHMRVCLKVDSRSETIMTISGSEPILAEAAFALMRQNSFHAPSALKSVLSGFSIHKGDRGELVAMLLLILARDEVICRQNKSVIWQPLETEDWNRKIPVTAFIRQLFHANLIDFSPLEADFKMAHLHFNQFMKPHEHAICHVQYLLRYLARGLALLCAPGMPGIDMITPIIFFNALLLECLSFALWQVKNNKKIQEDQAEALFAAMDPSHLHIWNADSKPRPIIRVILSVASRPGLTYTVRTLTHNGVDYNTHDIWCGGISPDFLVPVIAEDRHTWEGLVQASRSWEALYSDGHGKVPTRMAMNPGAATDSEFWGWAPL